MKIIYLFRAGRRGKELGFIGFLGGEKWLYFGLASGDWERMQFLLGLIPNSILLLGLASLGGSQMNV